MMFPHLFSPGRIGTMEVRNRIIASPMERNYCTAEGRVTQRYVDFLEARSRGGVGLMYTEATYVDPRGRGRQLQMGIYSDELIPDLARLVEAVHRHGARIGPELHYGGRVVDPGVSGLQSWAPSVVPYVGAGSVPPHAMELDEIADIVEKYGAGARRAREAGFDFIGIHGAHGYLLSQFLSPFTNKRQDEYGGDLQGRLRFPLEVIAAVRRAIGPDVPILYRMSGDERIEGGLTNDDMCEVAPYLQDAGVDLIDVSAGIYESNQWITQPMEMPQGVLVPIARKIRPHVGIPMSVSGRITDPSVAESILASGVTDFVTLGRAMHADPEFPNKAREGRLDEICTCIGCNQGCSDRHAVGKPILCLVNTATGQERKYAIRRSPESKRVLVVGAGPAGLECARIAALRGHQVTIFDRNSEPGGQILLNRVVPGREEMAGHIPWLSTAVGRAGARIELGVEVAEDLVRRERPDVVVLATGATLGIPQIPGILDSPVVDGYDVLRRPIAAKGRALVIGGGIRGVGIARVLAAKGMEIVLAEAGPELVGDIGMRSRAIQAGALAALPKASVHLRTTVEALGADEAWLWEATGKQWRVGDIGLVIPVRPLLPVMDLAALTDRLEGVSVHLVGDCLQPRNAMSAIHEAAALAHRL